MLPGERLARSPVEVVRARSRGSRRRRGSTRSASRRSRATRSNCSRSPVGCGSCTTVTPSSSTAVARCGAASSRPTTCVRRGPRERRCGRGSRLASPVKRRAEETVVERGEPAAQPTLRSSGRRATALTACMPLQRSRCGSDQTRSSCRQTTSGRVAGHELDHLPQERAPLRRRRCCRGRGSTCARAWHAA